MGGTGEAKGNCLLKVVLFSEIYINVGKFKSNKLALELRNINRNLSLNCSR